MKNQNEARYTANQVDFSCDTDFYTSIWNNVRTLMKLESVPQLHIGTIHNASDWYANLIL